MFQPIADKTMFLIEVTQAGIFQIRNIPDYSLGPILGIVLTTAALQGASVQSSLLLTAYAAGAATSPNRDRTPTRSGSHSKASTTGMAPPDRAIDGFGG